ncbi:hypothetical protein [Emticicia sp.]|uniref:hypothetical protein n=1 Tax=Emticicia sp. TaxID=1930953 RepID=UPI003750AF3E
MKIHFETMFQPIILSIISMISPNFAVSVLAVFGSLTFILLNISKLKFDIIDKDFNGSWIAYFKKLFNFK